MPSRNTWNGRWSGDNELFVIIRQAKTEEAATILEASPFRYNFGDGWTARIEVEQVSAKKAQILRKRSRGFCGYEWMVESIFRNGRIIT